MRKRVPRTPEARPGTTPAVAPPIVHEVLQTQGQPVDVPLYRRIGAQLGQDLSQARIHTGPKAAESADSVGAAAYTVGDHVVLGGSVPAPSTTEGQAVIAHELAHVAQQPPWAGDGILRVGSETASTETEAGDAADGKRRAAPPHRVAEPLVQRLVRVTAPRRGATGVALIPDFMDRLNRVSHGLTWTRVGENLTSTPIAGVAPDDFDTRMLAFAAPGAAEIPLRLITRHGLSQDIGGGPGLSAVTIDQLQEGYVDVEDLLASDDDSFRLNLIHVLAERSAVRDYARRVGTDMNADFPAAHRQGLRAERDHLRARLGDPNLGGPVEALLPGGAFRFTFPGAGYVVRHDFRPRDHGLLTPGIVTVVSGGQSFGLDEFILRRERERHAREVEQALGGGGPHIGP